MKLLFQNIDITCLIDAQTVNRRDNENRPERRIPCSMLDFGAARRFDPERIEAFPTLVTATLDEDQDAVEAAAISVGYLSPEDDPEYRQAVVDMVTTAAEPARAGRLGSALTVAAPALASVSRAPSAAALSVFGGFFGGSAELLALVGGSASLKAMTVRMLRAHTISGRRSCPARKLTAAKKSLRVGCAQSTIKISELKH